jgi:hypothetical protein
MTLKEQILFDQVHPVKLATDILSAIVSLKCGHHSANDFEVPDQDGAPESIAGGGRATRLTSTMVMIRAPPIALTTAVGRATSIASFRWSPTEHASPHHAGAIGAAIKPNGSWALKDRCRWHPIPDPPL